MVRATLSLIVDNSKTTPPVVVSSPVPPVAPNTTPAIVTPPAPVPAHAFSIPGEVVAPEYGLRLRGESAAPGAPNLQATLRPWRAGDRVTLKHSRGPKKVAEVLDRLHVVGAERTNWPVVEWEGKIVWMRGADVDAPEFLFTAVT